MLKRNISVWKALTPVMAGPQAAEQPCRAASLLITYQGAWSLLTSAAWTSLTSHCNTAWVSHTHLRRQRKWVSLSRITWETIKKILRKQSSLFYAQRRKVQNTNLNTNGRGILVFRLHLKISQKVHRTPETWMLIVQHFRSISLWNDSACPQKAIAPSAAHYR